MDISGHLEVTLYGVSLAVVYSDNYDTKTPSLVYYSMAIQPAKFYIPKMINRRCPLAPM
jgi:hypothetical protein